MAHMIVGVCHLPPAQCLGVSLTPWWCHVTIQLNSSLHNLHLVDCLRRHLRHSLLSSLVVQLLRVSCLILTLNISVENIHACRHLTSQYEEEEEQIEFEEDILKHPEDRLGDAGEDDENISTDWSKPYEIEEQGDVSEIQVVQTFSKPRLRRWNKVSFQDDLPDKEETRISNVHTVFAELNPAALQLERRLEKNESVETEETDLDLTSCDSFDG